MEVESLKFNVYDCKQYEKWNKFLGKTFVF